MNKMNYRRIWMEKKKKKKKVQKVEKKNHLDYFHEFLIIGTQYLYLTL